MAKHHARAWVLGAVGVLAVSVLCVLFLWKPQAPLAAGPPGQALLNASQGLDTVAVDAVFDPLERTLAVNQTLTLANRTPNAQRLLVLRAYANAFRSEDYSPAATDELYDACYPNGFSAGMLVWKSFTLSMAGSAEQPAAYTYGDDAQTVLRVSLPQDWTTGATLTLHLNYTVQIPQVAYRFGENNGIFALSNALVIPAPFVDGEYLTDAYGSIGDPFVSECRNYTVTVSAPLAYTVAGSAAGQALSQADGQRVTRFEAPAARDFALCISKGYQKAQAMETGVLVEAYALTAGNARAMLAVAQAALRCYGERYGAYPYPCMTLCEVDFPFGSAENPSLSLISTADLAKGGDELEQLVAREVAHQWWYAVVGSDSFRQAWQDEALCEFSLLDYWETRYGIAARDDLQYARLETAMRVTVPTGVTPGSPVDYFGDTGEYRLVVRGRGGAAMCALNTAMGGGLDAFLRRYYETFAFKLASRADFETLLKAFTGEDWSPLLSDYLDTYLTN